MPIEHFRKNYPDILILCSWNHKNEILKKKKNLLNKVENGFLMSKKSKIIVTGGSGRFGSVLKIEFKNKFIFPNKRELDILNVEKMIKYLKKIQPKYLIHLAGFSRPMVAHNKNISRSIKLNIIGTCNVVIACEKLNIKLIYFSTSYVYPGKKGNYKRQMQYIRVTIMLGQS